jgi:hypothetical protein
MLTEDQRRRFWAKVVIVDDADSCWLWTAFKDRNGYGRTAFRGGSINAHRFAYMLQHNLSEPPDLCVLHHCDVPACVRPSHLFLGTRADNMRDRHQKGRYSTKKPKRESLKKGIDLSVEDIEKIRAMRRKGEGYVYLSRLFKVNIFTICKIEQGRL